MLRVCRIAMTAYLVVNWYRDNDLMIARLTL